MTTASPTPPGLPPETPPERSQRVRLSPAQVYAMAALHRKERRLPQAAALYRAVVSLDPAATEPRLGLGLTLNAQGHYGPAAAVLERALALDPASGAALHALAVAVQGEGALARSTLLGKRSLALMPGNPDVENSLAHALLGQGKLAEGWAQYLARPSTRIEPNPFDRRPLPGDLQGRRLLVVADQGLGDEVFFLRFVPRLKQAGAWIGYQAHPKIAALFGRLPGLDHVSTNAASAPARIDTLLSVGDLPHLTAGFNAPPYPPPVALVPLAARVTRWRDRLAGLGPPPYTGVTWRAGVAEMLDKRVGLAGLAAALAGFPGTVISLQRQPADGEVEGFARTLGRPVADFGSLNEDLEDMLALLALLDELVGVSNTNVHLRAGLGRPARVLVPFPPEFRWPGNDRTSPWFPGFTLYRQRPAAGGGWEPALHRLRTDLAGGRTSLQDPSGSERS